MRPPLPKYERVLRALRNGCQVRLGPESRNTQTGELERDYVVELHDTEKGERVFIAGTKTTWNADHKWSEESKVLLHLDFEMFITWCEELRQEEMFGITTSSVLREMANESADKRAKSAQPGRESYEWTPPRSK